MPMCLTKYNPSRYYKEITALMRSTRKSIGGAPRGWSLSWLWTGMTLRERKKSQLLTSDWGQEQRGEPKMRLEVEVRDKCLY